MFSYRASDTHGITSHLYFVGVMQQPVTDCIGQGRVADIGMPVFDGALAGNNGGSQLVPVFDYSTASVGRISHHKVTMEG